MSSPVDRKKMVAEEIESFSVAPGTVNQTFGTVDLVTDNAIVLIPTPTSDPRDPLNLPAWRRLVIMIATSLFNTLSLTVVSGVGAVIGFFLPGYLAEGRTSSEVTYLFTLPALMMGVGNFFSMPLALAIGRRPVFLGSVLLVSLASVLCAVNKGYNWHLGARIVLGLAAGQSEALTPMMIQETHFLHERARVITWQWLIQSTVGGVLAVISSYQTAALGLRWWYGFYAIATMVLFLISFVLVPETKYNRPISAFEGLTEADSALPASIDSLAENPKAREFTRITTKTVREIDYNNFQKRTWASDMRMLVHKPDWKEAIMCYKHMAQMIFFPNVLWVVMMNGVLLGINVSIGTTYGNILLAPPYSWPASSVGFAQGGQIVIVFLGFPLLGFLSDWVIAWMSKRNGGVYEPEFRLVPLIFPTLVGIPACVIYGQAGSFPEKFHWFAIVFGYCAQFFSFVGASIAGQTYLLDAYPSRQGSSLVLVCAMRGVIQFGLSFGINNFLVQVGYAKVFGTYGGLTAIFGFLGVGVFFFGKSMRGYTSKWVVGAEEREKERGGMGEAYHVTGKHGGKNNCSP